MSSRLHVSSHPSIDTCLQVHGNQRKQGNNRVEMPYEGGVSGSFLKMRLEKGRFPGWWAEEMSRVITLNN